MASVSQRHDPRQVNIEDLSTVSQGRVQQAHNTRRVDHYHVVTSTTSHDEDDASLLGNVSPGCYAKVKSKFQSRRCCLWSSKAALYILLWNFVVSIGLVCFLDPSVYISAATLTYTNDLYVTCLLYTSDAADE